MACASAPETGPVGTAGAVEGAAPPGWPARRTSRNGLASLSVSDEDLIGRMTCGDAEIHFALGFELANTLDNAKLGGLDVALLDRAQEADFFVDRLGGAAGDGGKQGELEFLAGGIEREGQVAHVHFAHDLLQRIGVEQREILEGEHLLADGLAEVGIALLQFEKNRLADIAIERVEHVGGVFEAAGLVE